MRYARLLLLLLLLPAGIASAQTPTPTPVVQLVITPGTVSTTVGASFDLVVQVQAGTDQVDTAAAYLDFDHTVLQVTALTAGTALPVVVTNTYDNSAGTAGFAAATFSGFPTGTFTLVTAHFTAIAVGTSAIDFHLANPRMSGIAFGGASIMSSVVDGSVTVGAAAATPTPTATSPPAATPTTAPAPACAGDCDGNNLVTIDEAATCTSIGNGALPLSDCPACDANGDGEVTAADLIVIRNNMRNGCPSAPAPGAPPREACNPNDTDAQSYGKHFIASGVRAPWNVPMPTVGPTPEEGDVWPDAVNHQWCFRHYGTTYCAPATPQP